MHGDVSRNLGATGRREAAVPVEVGPARGQPNQPRRGSQAASPGAAQLLQQKLQQYALLDQQASPGAAQELLQLQLRQQASPGAAKELRHQQ